MDIWANWVSQGLQNYNAGNNNNSNMLGTNNNTTNDIYMYNNNNNFVNTANTVTSFKKDTSKEGQGLYNASVCSDKVGPHYRVVVRRRNPTEKKVNNDDDGENTTQQPQQQQLLPTKRRLLTPENLTFCGIPDKVVSWTGSRIPLPNVDNSITTNTSDTADEDVLLLAQSVRHDGATMQGLRRLAALAPQSCLHIDPCDSYVKDICCRASLYQVLQSSPTPSMQLTFLIGVLGLIAFFMLFMVVHRRAFPRWKVLIMAKK
jgi:hypothetical protein